MEGPTVQQFGIFKVTDDGKPGHLYGVWADLYSTETGAHVGDKLIGSGMIYENAVMVAKALNACRVASSDALITEATVLYYRD